MKKISLILLSILMFFLSVEAHKITISGYTKDSQSGEVLIGATIYNPKLAAGTTSNAYVICY